MRRSIVSEITCTFEIMKIYDTKIPNSKSFGDVYDPLISRRVRATESRPPDILLGSQKHAFLQRARRKISVFDTT